jgi:hypothetical protein
VCFFFLDACSGASCVWCVSGVYLAVGFVSVLNCHFRVLLSDAKLLARSKQVALRVLLVLELEEEQGDCMRGG